MIAEDLGQLNAEERRILAEAVSSICSAPEILEIGTWLGGGSTATFLRQLHQRGAGHLYGVEADQKTYDRMVCEIETEPGLANYFTPICGFSQDVIPKFLEGLKNFDLVFLDGGNNPLEQIEEFNLLEKSLKVGAVIFSHDANLRKGKWFVPYIREFDNWSVTIHHVSEEGLLEAKKIRAAPSSSSLKTARRKLMAMRMNPIEAIGTILPSQTCGYILKLLPTKLAKRLAEGRS